MSEINWELIKEKVMKGGSSAFNFVQDTVRDYVDEEIHEVINCERNIAITKTVVSLCAAGVKDESVIEGILHDYWHIDSHQRVNEYIRTGMDLEYPRAKLMMYMEKRGDSRGDIVKFLKTNSVDEKLKDNPKLRTLSPEKLLNAVQK